MPLKTRGRQGAKDFLGAMGEALLLKVTREPSFIGLTWPET